MILPNVKHNIFLLAIFCLGISAGLFFTRMHIFREKPGTYFVAKNLYPISGRLVNPLLRIETSQGNDPRLEAARHALIQYIDNCKRTRAASDVSVYLMNLNRGTWIGINEEAMFSMASLVKVPIMMAYLKRAEEDPSLLDKVITYEGKIDVLPQNIPPQNGAQPGNAYTVNQLLEFMIKYSDNVSMILLFTNIEKKLLDELCADLQLPILNLTGPDRKVSAKDYAISFQVLYNATYLNRASSEKALKMLTDREYKDGIIAGVPPNMLVAHKFAERAYAQTSVRELHECGIVYYHERPYLLCVMTKGRDFDTLKGVIRDITKIAHEHMEKSVVVL